MEKQNAEIGQLPVVADEAAAYGYEAENRHFVRAFLGKQEPLLTLQDGLAVVKLLMTAYRSAEERKTLRFPPPGIEHTSTARGSPRKVSFMVRAASLGMAILTSLALPASLASAQSEAEPPVAVEVPGADGYADTDPSALTDFRPALDPYGTWSNDPTYGTTWTPSLEAVGADFTPYDTAGRWDYVDGEYAWASDYAWGWVCFHYGRWVWSSGRWLWIPGREYAAAWVEWRVGDTMFGYIGWAPMPPAWTWVDGSAVGLGLPPSVPWSFAAYGDFLGPGISSRAIVGAPAVALLPHTRPYVRAQPTVAGEPPQPQRVMQGPPPAALGIDLLRVPRVAPNARELLARQYARPSTALPLGARAPVRHLVRPAPARAYAFPRAGIGPQVRDTKRR